MNAVQQVRSSQVQDLRIELEKMLPQFSLVLPKSIPPERFVRVVVTALNTTPDLLECDRRSLLSSCMRLAQDGYEPNGVDAALVPFKGQITPIKMIAGLRKKVRESGEVSDWTCEVVYAGDEFDYQLGDEPRIHHRPTLDASKRGQIVAAYSIVTFKDGYKSRDVFTRADIDKRRAVAKSQAIWNAWEAEMSAKTVGRHHAKELPTSNVIETFFRDHDDEPAAPTRPAVASSRRPGLDRIAGVSSGTDMPASDAAAGQSDTVTDKPSGEAAGDDASEESFAAGVTRHARTLTAAAEDGPLALSSAWARVPQVFRGSLQDTLTDLQSRETSNGKV